MIFITGPLYSGKRTFARTLPGHCIADVQQLAAGCKDNAELGSIWEQTHGMEFSAWVHEWEKLNSGTQADGLKFPDHLPEGFPTRRKPPEHPWTKSTSCK